MNAERGQSRNSQRGLALVMILALLLTVFTASVITHLSLNKASQQRVLATTQTLASVRSAVMAYVLMDTRPGVPGFNPRLQPPGTLPCPSADRGGTPAISGSGLCTLQRGLVPYGVLGIPEPLDGSGGPLWYAVDARLAGNSNPPLVKRNSSIATTLKVRSSATNQSNLVAFVVLAANQPVSGQTAVAAVPNNVSNFLEGSNAQSNTTLYDDLRDAHHNDQLAAVPIGEYWSHVEKRMLLILRESLVAYRNSTCARYPWPTSNFSAGGSGMPNTYTGGFPFAATDWATCGTPPPDTWITDHWSQLLYYAICQDVALPLNPPANKCLLVTDPTVGKITNAYAVLVAPGTELPAQNRALSALPNFFESFTVTVPNTFTSLPTSSHTGQLNDVVLTIE